MIHALEAEDGLHLRLHAASAGALKTCLHDATRKRVRVTVSDA